MELFQQLQAFRVAHGLNNLADAKEYCLNFRGGGFDDWRLPTIIELRELYASDLWKDARENNSKINIYWRLWSSTIDYVNGKPHSYAVYSFHNGRHHYFHDNTSSDLRALPVRNMQRYICYITRQCY